MDYNRTLRNAILFLFIFWLALPARSWAEDDAAKITGFKIVPAPDNPDAVIFKIRLKPAYPEGKTAEIPLAGFDEESISIFSKNNTIHVIMDMVLKEGLTYKYKEEFDFICGIDLKEKKGSHLNPEKQFTDEGRQIKSTRIIITGKEPVFYQYDGIDRDTKSGENIELQFRIQKAKEDNGEGVVSQVEIDMLDIGLKPYDVSEAPDNRLEITHDDRPRTVFYTMKHIPPAEANRIVSGYRSITGNIQIANDTNSLVISDSHEYVQNILDTLEMIDQPIPQVLIEAKIYEISWRKNERFGFNWGFSGTQDTEKFLSGNIKAGRESTSDLNSGINTVFGRLSETSLRKFNLQLDMLAGKDRVNLLATPRILALNNKPARFHAGEKIPVRKIIHTFTQANTSRRHKNMQYKDEVNDLWDTDFQDEDNYTEDSSDESTSTSVRVAEQYIDTGITLNVTPKIVGGKEIILNIIPKVSEIAGWKEDSDVPVINSREVNTTVKISDGDTILIAGLFNEQEVLSRRGIPGLKDIPGVGRLFQHAANSGKKTEVIFILRTFIIQP